jgi:hypothetical protein
MTSTLNLGISLISTNQAQKEVTFADAMNRVDNLLHAKAQSLFFFNPPTGVEGQMYIVATGATGAWLSQAGKLAYFIGGGWYFVTPKAGMLVFIIDVNSYYEYNGSSWVIYNPLVVAAKTANYGIALTDQNNLLQVDATAANIEVRLPPAGLATNGFIARVKKTAGANNVVVYGTQNQILRSEDYANASWTKSNSTISTGATAGPLFGILADKIQENNATSTHEIQQSYSKGAGITKLSASVYFKSAERTEAYILIDDGGGTNRCTVKANLSSGTLNVTTSGGTFTLDSSAIANVGNGWYRITAFCTVPTGAGTIRVSLRLFDGVAASYTGITGNGVFAYGVMLSENTVHGIYAKTVATAINELIQGSASSTISTTYAGENYICDGTNWLKL